MCSLRTQCWKLKRRHPVDYSLRLSCHLCWRWNGSRSSNCNLSWCQPKYCISHLWGSVIWLVDVWHIHWSCSADITEKVPSEGNFRYLLILQLQVIKWQKMIPFFSYTLFSIPSKVFSVISPHIKQFIWLKLSNENTITVLWLICTNIFSNATKEWKIRRKFN